MRTKYPNRVLLFSSGKHYCKKVVGSIPGAKLCVEFACSVCVGRVLRLLLNPKACM